MTTPPTPQQVLEALQHRRDGISMAAAKLIIDLRLQIITLENKKPVTPLNDAQPGA